ncbi:hypothetical protein INT47_001006 [Mucor saturninus]|uniref:Uncharacterized protein n=1 Tax=Mucor saturninus TaxID=64648 RepID=A0A8H7USM1_9FUNG|nr:hypothetical protein INT47_001006 [Mucor saturninus]
MESLNLKKIHHLPFVWDEFQKSVGTHIADIELILDNCNKDMKMDVVEDNGVKKRKFEDDPSSSATEYRSKLKNSGKCTFCEEKWTYNHRYNCKKRIEFFRSKDASSQNNVSNNLDVQNKLVAVIGTEIIPDPQKVLIMENPVADKEVVKESSSYTNYHDFSNALSDLETDNEYNRFLNKDDNISSDYFNGSNINNDYRVCAIKVKRNQLGDIDNEYKSDRPFSRFVPITINSVDSKCLIDSGADISLLSKAYADNNNIKYQPVDGCLIVADNRRVTRLRTTEALAVEYDNVDSVIHHKFDVLDKDTLPNFNSKTLDILVGWDLMPKLGIHLTNLATKYKSFVVIEAIYLIYDSIYTS